MKNIQNVGGNLAGVILNRIPISNKKYEEKYYYYGQEKFSTDNKKAKSKHLDIKEQEDINKEKIMRILNTDAIESNSINDTENNTEQNNENQVNSTNETFNMQQNITDYNQTNETQEDTNERYLEKTNNILDQIKDYLKNEKKDLN